ncbi:MAG: S9 family peptidase [Bradymonadaceae bacterium]|nr:S9 family peptidase [Lujinxingiaceae bacterium]
MKIEKTFGMWSSPLTPGSLAGELRLGDVAWAGDGESLVWLEGRDGRGVLVVKRPGDAPRDLNTELSVRGGVGYGGGEFTVAGEAAYFAASDGRLYRVELDRGSPRALTPGFGKLASPAVSPDGRWVVYVHCDGKNDVLGAVDTRGERWPTRLMAGADFYMQPAWHPASERLAWVAWDHPQMPWNGARLETARVHFDQGGISLGPVECLAGGSDVAVLQPSFSPDGRYLAYASDASGWWHIYVRDLESATVRQLTDGEVEYGAPAWVQGVRVFAWTPDSREIVAVRNAQGVSTLMRCPLDGAPEAIGALGAYQSIGQPAVSSKRRVALIGSSSQTPSRVVSWAVGEKACVERHSSAERLGQDELAPMLPVRWKVNSGGGEVEVFGNYYAPTSTRFQSPGKPPAIVVIHGGPTSQRRANFEANSQFFATRGFAVLDVNYRGSTGYGRAYMNALLGQWGVADVEDAVGAAKFLADEGLADPSKIVILGGSAGGYTVLQALVTHPGTFAAGVCLYGISNLFALQLGTHKFEAHYNDSLLGELPGAADIFRQRSPLFFADQITDPVAVYHGAKDEVVPLDQAEAIVASLRARGVAHLYHVYEDEGHGWRRAQNIEHYYGSVLGFLTEKVVFK